MERQEGEQWKKIALYLADCHAATAYDVITRKSSAKSEKRRQRSICKKALDMIDTGCFVGSPSTVPAVIDRITRLLEMPDA